MRPRHRPSSATKPKKSRNHTHDHPHTTKYHTTPSPLAHHTHSHSRTPPLKHTRPKPPGNWPATPEPPDTTHTAFTCKIPKHTPIDRCAYTCGVAHAPKQRVRTPYHSAHSKRPTERETDQAFSLPKKWTPAQSDATHLMPIYPPPSRIIHPNHEL